MIVTVRRNELYVITHGEWREAVTSRMLDDRTERCWGQDSLRNRRSDA